jgi:hypothetical protein
MAELAGALRILAGSRAIRFHQVHGTLVSTLARRNKTT